MSKIYLAIPFSGIEEISFKAANEVACELISKGNIVFSPISHSYPIWKTNRVEHTHDVWLNQDKAFIEWCDEVYLVIIEDEDGHTRINNSKGVQMELGWAKEQNKNVSYIHYNNKENTIEFENILD